MALKEKINEGVGKLSLVEVLNNNSKKAMILTVLVVGVALAAMGGIWTYVQENYISSNVVALVDGEKVTKADYREYLYGQDFIGTPEAPYYEESIKNNKSELKGTLDDFVWQNVIFTAAKEKNLTVSEAELTERYKEISEYDNFNDVQKEITKRAITAEILEKKLKNTSLNTKEGRFVFFRFDKYFEFKDEGMEKVQGAGDQKLKDEQREYAKNLSDSVYQEIKSGTLTFEQAMEKVNSDSKIGYEAFSPIKPMIKGSVDEEYYTENLGIFNPNVYSGIKEKVSNLKAGEFTSPFIFKTIVNGVLTESGYMIFVADKSTGGDVSSSEEMKEALLKKYKVKVYYPNIGLKDVKEKDYSLESLLKSITPKAYAACPVNYSSVSRTGYRAVTQRVTATGTLTRHRGASFRVYAGNSDPDLDEGGSHDLWVYTTTCGSYTQHYYYDKIATEEDNTRYADGATLSGGYMYGDQYYKNNTGDSSGDEQRLVLANCASTSTGAILFREPAHPSWVSGEGSWSVYSATAGIANGHWMSGNGYAYKMDMSGQNGNLLTVQMKYTPKYKNTLTVKMYLDGNEVTSSASKPGTVTSDISGINCGSTCSANYDPDTSTGAINIVKLTATTNSGYTFDKINSYTDGRTSINASMNADRTVSFYYKTAPVNSYTITPEADAGCSISPNTAQTVTSGGNSAQFTGSANSGYTYDGFSIDSASTQVGSTYTFNNVTANHTIRAKCTPAPAAKSLSCQVTPISGSAPLAITAQASFSNFTAANPTFDWDLGDGTSILSKPALIYYTFSQAGTYNVKVRNAEYNSNEWVSCPTAATVTAPSGGSGGEVTP